MEQKRTVTPYYQDDHMTLYMERVIHRTWSYALLAFTTTEHVIPLCHCHDKKVTR